MAYGDAQRLREEHGKLVEKISEMQQTLEREDRGFTPEEKETWQNLVAQEDQLSQRVDAAIKLETASTRYRDEDLEEHDRQVFEDRKAANQTSENRGLTAIECNKALRGWFLGGEASTEDSELARRAGLSGNVINLQMRHEDGVPKTMEDINRIYREKRAQSLTAAAGGYTVPDEMMRAIEVSMLTFGNVRAAATVITTTTGADLPIPTVNDTGNVGVILAENTQIAQQDMTFAQLVLNAYKYSSKGILVSAELMQDSSVNLPAFIGERLGERIARITNQHFTTGTGSSQPNGIVTAAGDSGVTTASNTAITWPELMSLKHSVDPAYRVGGAWMCDDAIVKLMKTMLDSTNRPIWQQSIVPGQPASLDGDPVIVNNDMATGSAAKALIYGNLAKYIVREVRGITVLRLDERYADYHQTGFLAFARYDGDLLDAGTDPVKYLTLAT